jgi:glycosyltransferase involved in cell wall biosynthesis
MTRDPKQTDDRRAVVMVGTGMDTMGGISTVVRSYETAGLFERIPLTYVTTHCDGSWQKKLSVACKGFGTFVLTMYRMNVRLVHVHLSSRASFWRKLLFILTAKLLRKPVVLHLHGSEFMTFYRDECGPVRRSLVRSVFDRADAIIALSPQWAAEIHTITKNPRVEVIFNGVFVPDTMPPRSHQCDSPNILFLGRLGNRKGIYDLLRALAAIREAGHEFRLVAAGDGEIAEVRAAARQLSLQDYVEAPGWIDGRGKARLLAQADIFVLPSHAEGLPMSLLEALAAGLPVVCSSVGGMPTAVTDGVEGFVVSPGDIDALTEAIQRLLHDAELRARLGGNAYKRAKGDFDVRGTVDKLLALYTRVESSCSRRLAKS